MFGDNFELFILNPTEFLLQGFMKFLLLGDHREKGAFFFYQSKINYH